MGFAGQKSSKNRRAKEKTSKMFSLETSFCGSVSFILVKGILYFLVF